ISAGAGHVRLERSLTKEAQVSGLHDERTVRFNLPYGPRGRRSTTTNARREHALAANQAPAADATTTTNVEIPSVFSSSSGPGSDEHGQSGNTLQTKQASSSRTSDT